MVKTILLIVLLLFAVSGICEFIYMLRMLLCFPGKKFDNYILVNLKSKYAVKQLNFLWQKIRWHGDTYAVGIIATTDSLDISEIFQCSKYAKNKEIILCKSEEISNICK